MDTSHNVDSWYPNALPRITQKALKHCAEDAWFENAPWFLAGGFDLDFFTKEKDFNQQAIAAHFPEGTWVTKSISFATLFGEFHGAMMSFIAYPFFHHKQPMRQYGTLYILHPRDIGVMKILAMSQRGRKRDFLDLYWLCHHVESLSWFMVQLKEQVPDVAHDYHHIIKALTYFDDAEKDEMPELNFHADWRTIKKFFQDEAKKLAGELLGIK